MRDDKKDTTQIVIIFCVGLVNMLRNLAEQGGRTYELGG